MNKKLPSIYRSEGTKKFVNKEVFYSYLEEKKLDSEDKKLETEEKNFKREEKTDQTLTINETLYQIFNRKGYSFNVPVHIKLKDKELDTFLAARTQTTLLTLDDEVIPIDSIISLQIKKP